MSTRDLDTLDVDLLRALHDTPRAGVLELSRMLGVARGTVQARLDRLERTGVITGYGPDIDVGAAGFGVQAFVTLEIAQGALGDVAAELRPSPRCSRRTRRPARRTSCAAWRPRRTRTCSRPS